MNHFGNFVKQAIELNLTISTIESCTGGMLASEITNVENSSKVYVGGLVTYSNDSKKLMGVDSDIIDKYGVYSMECAQSMAKAVRETYKTDIAVSITGTFSNYDPNNQCDRLGRVYYCIYTDIGMFSYFYNFSQETLENCTRAELKKILCEDISSELYDILVKRDRELTKHS